MDSLSVLNVVLKCCLVKAALCINSTIIAHNKKQVCVCVYVCERVRALDVIRLPCDMPYFSARGIAGSVLFHTPLGK